jgi:tetratricopeptide (TPR) repeat protein
MPALRHAVELQPANAPAHYSLGYGFLQSRDFDQAQAHFKQALALDSGYETAQYSLGLALWAGGKHDEALQSFRDAVRRWPASSEAYYNLGAALERSGQVDEAAASYTRATQLNPNYADANLALALIHARRGEHAAAINRLKRVLESSPDSVPAQTQLAWLLATSPNTSPEDHRTALSMAEQIVARTSGQDAGALDVLSAALAANGQFDRAAQTAERTLAALGNDADPQTVAAARERLRLYRSDMPYVALPNTK